MAFADKLKKLREEHGLSQAALAKRIYVSRSAVAKWENGLGLPDDGNLQALCGYFNVKEDRLMEREDLKKQLRIDKVQLGHILLCAGGILVPALCVLLGFCLTFTSNVVISIALYLPPRSLFAMFGRTGVNPPVPLFPRNEGHGDRIVFFRRRLGGNGGVFRPRPCPACAESQEQALLPA